MNVSKGVVAIRPLLLSKAHLKTQFNELHTSNVMTPAVCCRCFLGWQLPWVPDAAGVQPDGPSPWLKLFQNACAWCKVNSSTR